MKILRPAVYNALNGQVSYNGQSVPVYDKKRRVNSPRGNLFIILGSQREADDPQTSDAFITDSQIDIEIWQTTEFEVSEDPIDDVSDQVLQIIIPEPWSNGLGVQDHWQIQNVRRISAVVNYEGVTQTETVIVKTITIAAQIVQQNP